MKSAGSTNSLGIAVSGLPFQGQMPLRAGCVPQDHCLPGQAHSCRLHKAAPLKLLEKGVSKEALAGLVLLEFPCELLSAVLAGR